MKDIKNYEGLYAITMTGRVWSHRRKKFLKLTADGGYLQVSLCKKGKCKNFLVHRLVAKTYIPNPDNKSQVGHIDDNPKNNCWDNLYWTTALNNCNYGNRAKSCVGAKKVICIETGQTFRTINEAANKMNLYPGNISAACSGKRKTAGGYHFEYIKEDSV